MLSQTIFVVNHYIFMLNKDFARHSTVSAGDLAPAKKIIKNKNELQDEVHFYF